MSALEFASLTLAAIGGFFFVAGTAGLLRFPDTFTRLHAVTKVDNLGLGFTVAALALQAESWFAAGELVLVWLLALAASATGGYLMARAARRDDGR
jgi:multicomponent Na+:H+ antiporter subunit G